MQAPRPRAGFTELQKDAEASSTPAAQVPLMQWWGTGASRGCFGGQEDVAKVGLDLGEDSAHLGMSIHKVLESQPLRETLAFVAEVNFPGIWT